MEDSIGLVVSGKSLPNIKKDDLKEKSGYFKALLSGSYKDSNETSYKFNGWSTKAFEILVQFVKTGTVHFRVKNVEVLRTALEMADYLMMEGFRPQLCRMLVTSWSDIESNDALELADELGIKRSLEEYSMYKVLADVERQHDQSNNNYDILIMATSDERFWDVTSKDDETLEHLWEKVIQRYREVLRQAMKLSCHSNKAEALARNMQLHILDENKRSIVWSLLSPPSAVTKVLKDALEDRLAEARQNCRKILSHIRLPFVSGTSKVKTFGVAEFNMNSWSWKVKECKSKFTSTHCIVRRDYATFLGETGLLIIRMRKREPVIIKNSSFGEVTKKYFSDDQPICINGKHLFLLDQVVEGTPKLYQFNFYSKEFFECVEVSVQDAILKAHGGLLYIVGYSRGEDSEFRVFEYNINSKEISIIVSSHCIDFPLEAVVVVKRKIYVLSDDSFTIVDTLKKEDQPLEVKNYIGFVREMFFFMSFLDVALKDQDVVLLLYLSTNFEDRVLMVASLDLNTGNVSCLCVIPKVLDDSHFPLEYQSIYPQMELRRVRDGRLSIDDQISKRLKYAVD